MTPPGPDAESTRLAMVRHFAGEDAYRAARAHWLADLQSWHETVQALRAGITLHLTCSTPRPDGSPVRRRHRLHLGPDGSVTAPDHPEESDLDADRENSERLMIALGRFAAATSQTERGGASSTLGSGLPTCVHAALVLPRRSATITAQPEAGVNLLHARDKVVGVRLRTLHTLTQWAPWLEGATRGAHRPESWDGTFDEDWDEVLRLYGDAMLRYAITPAVLGTYLRAGWAVADALPWLQWRVPLDTAEQWVAAGKSGAAAARLCGLGQQIDIAAWLEVGFTAAQAAPWTRVPGMDARRAWEWHRRGLGPALFREISTTSEALGSPQWLDQTLEWVDAGVPGPQVLDWRYQAVPLEVAAAWSRHGMTYHHYLYATQRAAFTRTRYRRPIKVDPATIAPYLPYISDQARDEWAHLGVLVRHGLTMDLFQEHLAQANRKLTRRSSAGKRYKPPLDRAVCRALETLFEALLPTDPGEGTAT